MTNQLSIVIDDIMLDEIETNDAALVSGMIARTLPNGPRLKAVQRHKGVFCQDRQPPSL